MLLFTLPARQSRSKSIYPIAAWLYVQLRRQAAGLSRDEVARRLAGMRVATAFHGEFTIAATRADALALIEMLERPGALARYPQTIKALGAIFPIDADVYQQLANDPADRHPRICGKCGCSDHDPCTGPEGVCTLEQGLCSRCAGNV